MDSPYLRPTPKRWRRGWVAPVLYTLAALIAFLVFQCDLLDNQTPVFTDVLIARYVLGRWPKTWKEVEQCDNQYEGVSDDDFDSVAIVPQTPDRCSVTFLLHNSLGWRYSKTEVVVWTKEEAARFAQDDERLQIALPIQRDVNTWVASVLSR